MWSEKEKAEIESMLNSLVVALYYTSVGAHVDGNHIIRFDLVERAKPETNGFGAVFNPGDYVRPVWSDNPERNDGYYDINVSGESVNGVFYSVTRWLTKHYI